MLFMPLLARVEILEKLLAEKLRLRHGLAEVIPFRNRSLGINNPFNAASRAHLRS